MNYLVLILRLVHIVGGVFWVGSSMISTFFLSPAVAATGDSGQKFMAHLVTKAGISTRITGAAILTVLAGGWLYWIDSGGLTSAWQYSGAGIGFGIGGFLALVGLAFGIIVGVNTAKLGKLASEIQGKPSPEQMTQIQAAQRRLAFAGPVSTITLIIALICMATARYWVF